MRAAVLNRPTPSLQDGGAVVAIRNVLRGISYTEANCCKVLGLDDMGTLWYKLLQLQASFGPADSTIATLIYLFLLNMPIPRSTAMQFWPRGLEEHLLQTNLILSSQQLLVPLVSIFPCENLLVVTDLTQDRVANDQVFWLSPDTYWLAKAITQLQGEGKQGLDIGTGSGVHALLLAKHNFTVVAVEVNPRANQFARFNGALNELDKIDWHTSSLYSGFQSDERFDVVVAHPPYSPDDETAPGQNYWSGGFLGDAILHGILAGLFEFLTDGGVAIICTLVIYRAEETVASRLNDWLGRYMKYFDIIVERKQSDYGTMLQHRVDEEGRRRYAHWSAMKIESTDIARLFIRKNLSSGGNLTVKTV